MTDSHGWIASPDRDMDGVYDFNVECEWFIQVSPGKVIQLQILYLIVANDRGIVGACYEDQLSVSICFKVSLESTK